MTGDRPAASDVFGRLLRQYRLAAGLSQQELADKSGISVRAIANMERGRTTRPYRSTLGLLTDALGLDSPATSQLERASRSGADIGVATPTAEPAEPARAGPGEVPLPRQLPAPVPDFVGRAAALDALTSLTDRPGGTSGAVVISAIAGTAGVGKTGLAVHWAHRVVDRFPDGQLYVNLRGYDPGPPLPPADALAGFLRALGVPGQDIPPDTEERSARFRSLLAGKQVLVLLDNAREPDQVRPLLPGAGGSVAVITSRDSLAGLIARDGARRLELDVLPADDAISLLRALIGTRVDAEPAAALALAERCSRLPLALRVAAELAAARPSASLAELACELTEQQERLNLLVAGGDSQTDVRAVFSWSYQQLPAPAARAFRLLGRHPGTGFDAYAVAALAGCSQAQAGHLLDQLSRAHLVQPTGQNRYATHDLLRAYAGDLTAEWDSEPERRAALGRLLDLYLQVAVAAMNSVYPAEHHFRPKVERRTSEVPPVGSPAAALAWLDAERPNLVAAVACAADSGWPGHAGGLAATLSRYLDLGSHHSEAAAVHAHAARAARDTGDLAGESAALNGLGVLEWRKGNYEAAAGLYQQVLSLARSAGDQAGQLRALSNLGLVAFNTGRLQEAGHHYEQALALGREIDYGPGQMRALTQLGNIDRFLGRYRQADTYLQESLFRCRAQGDQLSEADALSSLGLLRLRQDRCQEALEFLRPALPLYRKVGDKTGEAVAWTRLGLVALGQGDTVRAGRHMKRALTLSMATGHLATQAEAHNGLGEVLLATGQHAAASSEHETALSLASKLGEKYDQARAHDGLARCHRASGNEGLAREHWEQALALYASLGTTEADQVRSQLITCG
jgi:tetratricopeptide (TPR) repeat protein/transcriptional regulator with XRE-family HTH domain